MVQSILSDESLGFLKVITGQARYDESTVGRIGQKPTPKRLEVSGGNCCSTYFSREDRLHLDEVQPRNEASGARLVQELQNLGRAEFDVIGLSQGTGVKEVVGHLAFVPLGDEISRQ